MHPETIVPQLNSPANLRNFWVSTGRLPIEATDATEFSRVRGMVASEAVDGDMGPMKSTSRCASWSSRRWDADSGDFEFSFSPAIQIHPHTTQPNLSQFTLLYIIIEPTAKCVFICNNISILYIHLLSML